MLPEPPTTPPDSVDPSPNSSPPIPQGNQSKKQSRAAYAPNNAHPTVAQPAPPRVPLTPCSGSTRFPLPSAIEPGPPQHINAELGDRSRSSASPASPPTTPALSLMPPSAIPAPIPGCHSEIRDKKVLQTNFPNRSPSSQLTNSALGWKVCSLTQSCEPTPTPRAHVNQRPTLCNERRTHLTPHPS